VTPLGKDSDRDGITDPGDSCPRQRGPAPSGCPDADGVPDRTDQCKNARGNSATGCPAPATEWVLVYLDGDLMKKVRMDREFGVGAFDVAVRIGRGKHTIRTVWADRSGTLAAVTRRVG